MNQINTINGAICLFDAVPNNSRLKDLKELLSNKCTVKYTETDVLLTLPMSLWRWSTSSELSLLYTGREQSVPLEVIIHRENNRQSVTITYRL